MRLEVFSLCEYGISLTPVLFMAQMLELSLHHKSNPSWTVLPAFLFMRLLLLRLFAAFSFVWSMTETYRLWWPFTLPWPIPDQDPGLCTEQYPRAGSLNVKWKGEIKNLSNTDWALPDRFLAWDATLGYESAVVERPKSTMEVNIFFSASPFRITRLRYFQKSREQANIAFCCRVIPCPDEKCHGIFLSWITMMIDRIQYIGRIQHR